MNRNQSTTQTATANHNALHTLHCDLKMAKVSGLSNLIEAKSAHTCVAEKSAGMLVLNRLFEKVGAFKMGFPFLKSSFVAQLVERWHNGNMQVRILSTGLRVVVAQWLEHVDQPEMLVQVQPSEFGLQRMKQILHAMETVLFQLLSQAILFSSSVVERLDFSKRTPVQIWPKQLDSSIENTYFKRNRWSLVRIQPARFFGLWRSGSAAEYKVCFRFILCPLAPVAQRKSTVLDGCRGLKSRQVALWLSGSQNSSPFAGLVV